MFLISQFISRLTASSIRRSNSLQSVFIRVRSMTEKYYKQITRPMKVLFMLPPPMMMLLLDADDVDNGVKEKMNESTVLCPLKKSCDQFLNSTMDFLNGISDVFSDSASQYKTALTELCSCLEKYAISKDFDLAGTSELEDKIISARAKVYDCEKRYLEFTTVTKSIVKVTDAIGGLSFLLREETLALKLNDTLSSILEKIELDSTEINSIKRKLYEIENNEINTVYEKHLGD